MSTGKNMNHLTILQCAAILGIDRQGVYARIKRGVFPKPIAESRTLKFAFEDVMNHKKQLEESKTTWKEYQRQWKLDLFILGIKQSDFCRKNKIKKNRFCRWVNCWAKAHPASAEKINKAIAELKK
jgi:predicted DNA-binding transcriptional regulator AlpA